MDARARMGVARPTTRGLGTVQLAEGQLASPVLSNLVLRS